MYGKPVGGAIKFALGATPCPCTASLRSALRVLLNADYQLLAPALPK